MSRSALVIGAGMGGLTAALRLARAGCRVVVVEAADRAGGLAAGLVRDGLPFDAGPYLLLDRPGLAWAFERVGLDLAACVPMRRVEDVYQVEAADGSVVRFRADLGATAEGIERSWPGAGARYRAFVAAVARAHDRLRPLLTADRPGPWDLLRTGAWRDVPFLLRPLGSVLARAGLPRGVAEAVAIWTHVAGQSTAQAPSPLAFVAAILHGVGAYYPDEGLGAVPHALAGAAVAAGVDFRFGTEVAAIFREDGRARGAVTRAGETLEADAVVSNRNGVGTYLDLIPDALTAGARRDLEALPLQSPGVCAYLAVRGGTDPPYLRFRLPGGGELCRLLVTPAALVPGLARDGWSPARLIAPMTYAEAQRRGPAGQRAYLERVLAEPWWREHVGAARVLDARTPAEWGAACHLHRESMNPVMTARFMRAGRLAHRSPHAGRLYLAGSATHPGQWVSFCAISGVLAADRALEDLG